MKKIVFKSSFLFVCGLSVLAMALAAVPAWAEEGKSRENTIDIGKMTCKQLMSGNDTDRDFGRAANSAGQRARHERHITNCRQGSLLRRLPRAHCRQLRPCLRVVRAQRSARDRSRRRWKRH